MLIHTISVIVKRRKKVKVFFSNACRCVGSACFLRVTWRHTLCNLIYLHTHTKYKIYSNEFPSLAHTCVYNHHQYSAIVCNIINMSIIMMLAFCLEKNITKWLYISAGWRFYVFFFCSFSFSRRYVCLWISNHIENEKNCVSGSESPVDANARELKLPQLNGNFLKKIFASRDSSRRTYTHT